MSPSVMRVVPGGAPETTRGSTALGPSHRWEGQGLDRVLRAAGAGRRVSPGRALLQVSREAGGCAGGPRSAPPIPGSALHPAYEVPRLWSAEKTDAPTPLSETQANNGCVTDPLWVPSPRLPG